MTYDFDWRLLLKKSECKSRDSNQSKSIQLSSIDGWSSEKLPKLVIIWTFDKVKSERFPSNTRPGKFTKKRDISARISSFEIFLVDSEKYIVPWLEKPSYNDIVKTQWTQEWHNLLRDKTKKLNTVFSNRPIRFQASFKNIGGIMRLQYEVKDYTKLPPCPPDLVSQISPHLEKLNGAEIRLWKDHTFVGGPKGWLNNEMAEWEHNNSKAQGTLYVKIKHESEFSPYPNFSEGRQDYWTGFAIDFLIGRIIPGFKDLQGHVTGADHQLDFDVMQ